MFVERRIVAAPVRAGGPWVWPALLAAAVAAAVAIGWVGFIASDDSLYYAGATPWLDRPPFAGVDHWSTRFPLTLTFAGVLAVVGRGYAAFAITSLAFYAAVVAATGLAARRIGGRDAGWAAALVTATLPVVVSHATTVSVDLAEAAALIAGALLIARAGDDAAGLRRGLAGGALFGVAMLCRETSVLPLVAFVPMFLLGRPVPRRVLVAAGVGIAAVLVGDALFQWAMTGEPLRRYDLAFHHDAHIDRAANHEGNLLLHPAIDPLLVLLVNDDFGLLFWLAGAAVARGVGHGMGRSRAFVLLAAMAVAAFALVAVLTTKLVLNPRYFMLPALVAAIVVALWAARLTGARRALLLSAVVASNLALLSVGNAHPRWSMEALVAAAASNPRETVWGEASDARRAALPLGFAGIANVRGGEAPAGTLVVRRADAAGAGRVIARYPSPPTRAGAAVRAIGLAPLVPAAIERRLMAPSPDMVLVRGP